MKPSKDRRSHRERRQNKRSPAFPFRDDSGVLVSNERRQLFDRRTEGFELTVSDMPQEEFEEYFKDFQENPNT